jgi:hypothetical protein
MDIAKLIQDALRHGNVAISTNVGEPGRRTSVYADDDVTIIERDGERQVIHRREEGDEPSS